MTGASQATGLGAPEGAESSGLGASPAIPSGEWPTFRRYLTADQRLLEVIERVRNIGWTPDPETPEEYHQGWQDACERIVDIWSDMCSPVHINAVNAQTTAPAIAIEAGQGGNGAAGAVGDESAGPQDDAQGSGR